MVGTTRILAASLCGLVLSLGAPALAGILDDNAAAYNDGNGPGTAGRWAGTAAYTNGTIMGTVDYAVFTANAFTTAFPLSGYSPTANQLVYAFQVRNGAGSAALSFEGVSADPANNIGNFELESGDIPPALESFNVGTAEWNFFNIGGGTGPIGANENSYGLVFSSENRPELTGTSATIDGGTPAYTTVPTPGDNPIPEPASVLLLLCGAGALISMLRRR